MYSYLMLAVSYGLGGDVSFRPFFVSLLKCWSLVSRVRLCAIAVAAMSRSASGSVSPCFLRFSYKLQ